MVNPADQRVPKQIKDEIELIVQWLDNDRIAPLSSGERALFYFIRDVNFDVEDFGVILKEHFPGLWYRLVGEAQLYKKRSR